MSACAGFGGTLPGFQLLRDDPDGADAAKHPELEGLVAASLLGLHVL